MFEKYTAKAREAVFYSRYEAREDGSPYAQPAHLLLGICRDNPHFMARILGPDERREKLEHRLRHRQRRARPKIATAVDLPPKR
jgi:hypothetical protein